MAGISEQKRAQIQEEAREILEKFSKALQKVSFKERKKPLGESFREEGTASAGDIDFRKRMFANAPEKNEDCIIAEKKIW